VLSTFLGIKNYFIIKFNCLQGTIFTSASVLLLHYFGECLALDRKYTHNINMMIMMMREEVNIKNYEITVPKIEIACIQKVCKWYTF
jgi:hypothetical protein